MYVNNFKDVLVYEKWNKCYILVIVKNMLLGELVIYFLFCDEIDDIFVLCMN